jgi:hypothetical protein
MTFRVLWTPAAEQDLAAVWIDADDRNAVTSAAYTLDSLLSSDPASRGEPRFDTVRTLSVPPLGVDSEVVEADWIVWVLSAWDTTRREEPPSPSGTP